MPTSIVAAMTTDTAPSPLVAAASSEYDVLLAWQAFGGPLYWLTLSNAGWLRIYMGAGHAHRVGSYAIAGAPSTSYPVNRNPNTWTFQGCPDGADPATEGNWVTLDTRTGETGWNAAGETRTYACAAHANDPYAYFRLKVSVNDGGAYLAVKGLYIYDAPPSGPLAFAAVARNAAGSRWWNHSRRAVS